MDDQITHLLAADANTAPSTPRISVGRVPAPFGILLNASDGARPVSLDVVFANPTVSAAGTDVQCTVPIPRTRAVVPAGWIARLYLLTMQTFDDGDDITLATGKLFVDDVDASASWDTLFVVPTASDNSFGSALPLASPFTIDASAGLKIYDVRTTTDGSAGTVAVAYHVMGYMFTA